MTEKLSLLSRTGENAKCVQSKILLKKLIIDEK